MGGPNRATWFVSRFRAPGPHASSELSAENILTNIRWPFGFPGEALCSLGCELMPVESAEDAKGGSHSNKHGSLGDAPTSWGRELCSQPPNLRPKDGSQILDVQGMLVGDTSTVGGEGLAICVLGADVLPRHLGTGNQMAGS